jgi:hypothetical protein
MAMAIHQLQSRGKEMNDRQLVWGLAEEDTAGQSSWHTLCCNVLEAPTPVTIQAHLLDYHQITLKQVLHDDQKTNKATEYNQIMPVIGNPTLGLQMPS